MKTIKKLINKLFSAKSEQSPKKEYYFRVYRWMAKMPISGYEKMVYAYIYGYNYHERGFCYVAEQLGGGVFGVSAETMNSIMDKLVEQGYLFKDARGLFWCDKFKEKTTKKIIRIMKPKIEIKSVFGDLIFEFEKENNTIKDTLLEAIQDGANLRSANLRSANLCGANLYGANLYGANLYGANLCGANLYGANLYGANLRSADLCGANLCGANLRSADLCGANLCGANLRSADLCCANLCGANLCGANLCGANLCGADLCCANLRSANLCGANLYGANLCGANLCGANGNIVGKIEDWMSHDNIGSRKSRTLFFKTDKGVFVQCGCFFGNLEEFVAKVKETHQGNKHERDYLALVEFIKVRFEL